MAPDSPANQEHSRFKSSSNLNLSNSKSPHTTFCSARIHNITVADHAPDDSLETLTNAVETLDTPPSDNFRSLQHIYAASIYKIKTAPHMAQSQPLCHGNHRFDGYPILANTDF